MVRRTLMVAAAATLAIAALVTARPTGAEARAQCDPGLSACLQLQQAEQQNQEAWNQLNQIAATQASAQQKAQQISDLVTQAQAAVQAQENAIAQTQAQIVETERNERYTQATIDRDQATVQVRQQLVDEQVRSEAETDQTSYLQVLLTAQNFSQFVNRAMLVNKLIQSNQNLVDQVQAAKTAVQAQQASLQKQHYQETTLLNQQVQQEVVLQAQLDTQNQALEKQQQLVNQIAAQNAQQRQVVNDLMQQIQTDQANYQQQVYQRQVQQEQAAAAAAAQARQAQLAASVSAGPAAAAGGGGWGGLSQNTSGANAYPWGQCTYYVATIYNIPGNWGNANTWFPAAQAAGYATTLRATPGAIVVWGSGGGYSVYGHVGVVQSVQNGSFTVTEMNFYGVGIVDSRQVNTMSDIEGFIV